MSEEQIRNRNNSMQPIPGLRDDYYRNAPTPAVFNHEYSNNCLFHNKDQQYNVTSNNNISFDNSINSIQQHQFKQNQYKNSDLLDPNINSTPKENYSKSVIVAIDSLDRDIDVFPNSLGFRVKFNPSNGATAPYIDKDIKNISSIKINAVIVPNYFILQKVSLQTTDAFAVAIKGIVDANNTPDTDIVTASNTKNIVVIWYKQIGNDYYIDFFDNDDALLHEKVYSAVGTIAGGAFTITSFDYYTYKPSNPTLTEHDRFLFIEFAELKGRDQYSTDHTLGYSFGTLYQDSVKCSSNFCYLKSSSNLNFSSSDLFNLSTLTISFYNSLGEKLDTSINKNMIVDNKSKSTIYNSDGTVKYMSPSKYIRHPLYINSNCHIILSVNFIEPELNRIIFN